MCEFESPRTSYDAYHRRSQSAPFVVGGRTPPFGTARSSSDGPTTHTQTHTKTNRKKHTLCDGSMTHVFGRPTDSNVEKLSMFMPAILKLLLLMLLMRQQMLRRELILSAFTFTLITSKLFVVKKNCTYSCLCVLSCVRCVCVSPHRTALGTGGRLVSSIYETMRERRRAEEKGFVFRRRLARPSLARLKNAPAHCVHRTHGRPNIYGGLIVCEHNAAGARSKCCRADKKVKCLCDCRPHRCVCVCVCE